MNKGDTVVFVQALGIFGPPWNPYLIEMTVERDYGGTISLSDGQRMHLVSADLVFPDMETAVKAVSSKAITNADAAKSAATTARYVADNWLLKLKEYD